MPTTWNERQLEIANRFTERMEVALAETGLDKEQWYGFVLGWTYGQLRQRFSKEIVRQAFERGVAQCERELDDAAKS